MALASIPLFLVTAAIIRKEYSFVFVWLAAAILGFSLIIALHGTLFTLPLTAQRALSWLPGRWDATLSSMEGGKDIFREKLRDIAMEKIEADPWVGRGYAVDRRIMSLIAATPNQSEKFILQLAQGSSWHNTWLGYAADFGIPASIFQAIIYGHILWVGIWAFRRVREDSMMQTIVLYIVLFTVRDVFSSHTGGHSSLGPFERWWMYGVLIGVALGVRSREIGLAPREEGARRLSDRARSGLSPSLRKPAIAGGAVARLAQERP
jgi:O-antigen ligase